VDVLLAYRLWDRFRAAPWQRLVRLGLAPVAVALVIARGIVIAHTADNSWQAAAVSIAMAAITLATRLNPYGCF
jgi:chromate transporter